MEVINDNALAEVIIEDLMNNYDLSEVAATAFVEESGAAVVDAMWNGFSDELNYLVPKYIEDL